MMNKLFFAYLTSSKLTLLQVYYCNYLILEANLNRHFEIPHIIKNIQIKFSEKSKVANRATLLFFLENNRQYFFWFYGEMVMWVLQ